VGKGSIVWSKIVKRTGEYNLPLSSDKELVEEKLNNLQPAPTFKSIIIVWWVEMWGQRQLLVFDG
jgi:type III secretion system FlhB-like substrate exporter